MLRAVDGRRHQRIKCMDEAAVVDVAAPFIDVGNIRAVVFVADAEHQRAGARIIRRTAFQWRHIDLLEGLERIASLLRDHDAVRREPAAAEILLKERIDGVQDAAAAAGQHRRLLVHFHVDAFQTKLSVIYVETIVAQRAVAADENRITAVGDIVHDVQTDACHLFNMIHKIFRRMFFRQRRLQRQHDGHRVRGQFHAAQGDFAFAQIGLAFGQCRFFLFQFLLKLHDSLLDFSVFLLLVRHTSQRGALRLKQPRLASKGQ